MDERIRCLTASRSPFVLEGLKSPVRWWGWCREAFEEARRLDRPVLVDVGAIWCHWCHVMDETTYADPEVARLINENFVAVKVDRDERPDIDRRLQEVAAAVSGQSGWPLTVFMTPGGEVIWAATYLPPRDQGGLPGMPKVLEAVLKVYRERRGDVSQFSRQVMSALEAAHSPAPGEPDRSAELDVLAALAASFDEEYSGFGGAPKFPPITQLELLLLRYYYDGKGIYRRMAEATLDAMALGGMYDHLGGGFFRYSTDRRWLIPHYEKMLIDNAELLALYAQAYALLGKELYRRTAAGVVAWLDEFMRRPGGGYHASQDADVDGEEGAYYRWTLEEIREALGPLADRAIAHFGLLEEKWPEGKATLRVARPVDGMEEIYARLREARRRRRPPYVDRTVYTGWSCAAAAAELAAGRLAGVGDRGHALATVDYVMSLWDGSALPHGVRDGEPVGRDFLEDYGRCVHAALEAFAETGRLEYLHWAASLGRALAERFLTEAGFRDAEVEELPLRVVPVTDTPNASGNAVAIWALDRLAAVAGLKALGEAADRALRAVLGRALQYGPAAAGLFLALDFHLAPPPRTVVVGDSPDLLSTALRAYRPGHTVVPVLEDWPFPEPSIRAMAAGPKPAAYVCAGTACSMPIRDPAQLAKTIAEFQRQHYALT